MCTCVTFASKHHYFGRNLDLDYSYRESVTITPRNYPFLLRKEKPLLSHYAMIGMAFVQDNYPLYYDATNEYGLSMAGLNFPDNAFYGPVKDEDGFILLAPYEFIPYCLGKYRTVKEARLLFSHLRLVDLPFSPSLPNSPLHWMMADQKECVVIEATKDGIRVYDNPVGVMTNNPTFDEQLHRLVDYRHLSPKDAPATFAPHLPLPSYSRGMGAMGLPGDLSSPSRFVKAAFVRNNSLCEEDEMSSVSQFFHILASVEQPRGCCDLGNQRYEITIYSSCCNMEEGIYYYRTYDNSRINAVALRHESIEEKTLVSYPLLEKQQICYIN